LGVVLGATFLQELGIGTLSAITLPCSRVFFVGWSLLFLDWVFMPGLPVGPGTPTFYSVEGVSVPDQKL